MQQVKCGIDIIHEELRIFTNIISVRTLRAVAFGTRRSRTHLSEARPYLYVTVKPFIVHVRTLRSDSHLICQ